MRKNWKMVLSSGLISIALIWYFLFYVRVVYHDAMLRQNALNLADLLNRHKSTPGYLDFLLATQESGIFLGNKRGDYFTVKSGEGNILLTAQKTQNIFLFWKSDIYIKISINKANGAIDIVDNVLIP